ncbi:myosin phosphatase Rho-interacting protein isoform X2 [Bombina bombina]|uniref:myosin phosphatase Rho-interacting protein isoform X2 n=1 Tax=Bombina bombina TaxID=8345 RepID=UPI00235B0A1F|nr:myosin phosphatase Rho-interacting protein isoform X2 [Bombina bombina]XP_053550583.1 myosin phosphatase Rho-interacting protein isoform X2 [Bombina bombina]XP_053550584.1 myosin phosphatase Rho-interacting protein isoform X2 [Bombina bombina]
MSVKENPCKKFQANIFNKSKCQNCFKPRESHLLSDEDLNQAKPIYGGWLLLAPEGTDFDNPMHRSRKWQRRFFILYEHGLLRYALDEMPTTLPQGTINMNQCTDVIDGESRTGQKYSLCILTPEEHFIRAENKEIINGWLEMLVVYPRTNKQNQKKKRKVEPPTPQEPGPAKMAVTSSGIPSAEKIPATKSTLWQEEIKGRDVQENSSPLQSPLQMPSSPTEPLPDKVDGGLMNGDRPDGGRKTRVESGYFSLEKTKDLKSEEQPIQTPPSPSTPEAPSRYSYPKTQSPDQDPFPPSGNELSQQHEPQSEEREGSRHFSLHLANREYAILADVPRARRISHKDAFQVEKKRLEQRIRARSPGREEVARLFGQQRRRSIVIEKFEALDIEKAEHMDTNFTSASSSNARQGRSEKRTFPRKRDETGVGAIPDVSASHMSPYRRAKSLDRRSTESSMTPDLLNFKKGWLTKLYPDGQWKKHWFVLTDQTLRYYRDSVAEEAADLDGEISLSTCYDVTEHPVQRNYGFQIHTKEGEFTLSAMTSGIRRNWIQTIMKHVRPSSAPDVTSSLPEEKSKTSIASSYNSSSLHSDKQEPDHSDTEVEQKRSRARERRREGRSKTFDWAEFRPIQQALAQERAQAAEALKSLPSYDTTDCKTDLGELERERARRREERRKRFESTDSVEESTGEDASRMEVDKGPVSPNVQVEIEQRWQQVETTPLREEKQIPISPLPLSSTTKNCPSEDITAHLEKQLEQSQKEVSDLLEQNLVLQQRLKEALEQQQSARDGYVLQTELADPSPDAWERLHKVNEDLQNELEAQSKRQELLSHQMQTIKHSYGEAKESIRQHEAEIRSLQARLSSTVTELSIKEQALIKLKGDLEIEKEKVREIMEEGQNTEASLTAQVRASQQKLKEAESLLLVKTQELRELETEQALQKDYQKEMQRLQDKLAELSFQLAASEQAQVLTEERLQKNYEELLVSCEKEKQLLLNNLKETEERLVEYEDRLQENEQLMEVLQKKKLHANAENSIIVHHLEEQLVKKESRIQKLEEYAKELEEEMSRLKSTCQEMTNQITVSDTENAELQVKLKMREVEYYELENSLTKVSEELLSIQKSLREKEEEFRSISETHSKVVEKKDQDINEALVKMAALGCSLEETEIKLKAKEEALNRFYSFSSEPQAKEIEKLCVQLEAAKNRIVELEQNLKKGDAGNEATGSDIMEVSPSQVDFSLNPAVLSKYFSTAEGGQDIGAKRQRIRFSSIQCQKYVHGDCSEKTWTSSTSSDTSQDRSLSEESAASEAIPLCLSSVASDTESYLSTVHSLETKLYVTEEKLKDVTLKLENEKMCHQETLLNLHSQWAITESSLREQLQSSINQISTLAKQLKDEKKENLELTRCCSVGIQKESVCFSDESSNISLLNPEFKIDENDSTLSDTKSALLNTFGSSHQTQSEIFDEGYSTIVQGADWNTSEDTGVQSSGDPLRIFTDKISFVFSLINKIADALKSTNPETIQIMQKIDHTSEPSGLCDSRSPADILVNKLSLEREFWSRAESLGTTIVKHSQGSACVSEIHSCSCECLQTLADSTLIKTELSFVTQKMESYCQYINKLETELQNTKAALREGGVIDSATGSYGCLETQADQPCSSHYWSLNQTVRLKESSLNDAFSFQDELSNCLKEKADLLKKISATILSMPSHECQTDVQKLLDISKQLSSCSQALCCCNSSTLHVWDAVAQAQMYYVACKARLECEREAESKRDDLWHNYSNTLTRVRQEYEEMLLQKQKELSDLIALNQREHEISQAMSSQSESAKRCFKEAELKFNESMSQLKCYHEEEIKNLMEKWTEMENILKGENAEAISKLDSLEQVRQDAEKKHKEQIEELQSTFHNKIQELKSLHRAEFISQEDRYTCSIRQLQDTLDAYQSDMPSPKGEVRKSCVGREHQDSSKTDSIKALRERILELETEVDIMREELDSQHMERSISTLKEKYQADLDNLKATCERGFAAMEETHHKKIDDLLRQHHRELEKLREEKDRLLAEETAATISAIEAMKNAHREELERELEKTTRSQISSINADVESLRRQYLEELQSIQRELEVLSEQYSQKCLENAHLVQALEAERQALRQCQRENQELNAHNQELNNRLATEITRLRILLTGDGSGDVSPLTLGKDAYELEVLLRVKESEIQYQKQEISSLKDELNTTLKDKKYASDKYKDIYTELSNVKAKAECDISRLKEQLKVATEMLGDKTPENASVPGYDIMKSKSNPDFLKNDRSSIHRQLRNIRSKSVIEQVSWDN